MNPSGSTNFTDKTPPNFSAKYDDYTKWKRKLNLWKSVTEVDKKKHGGLILLRLDDETQDTILEALGTTDINVDAGADLVVGELDKVFQKNKTISAYETYEQFENYRRPSNLEVSKFIHEFEKRYNKIKAINMTMTEDILAIRLMKSANLSEHNENLIKATISKLDYKEVKEKMLMIFNTSAPSNAAESNIKVESDVCLSEQCEEVLYGKNFPNKRSFSKQDSDRFMNTEFKPKQNSNRFVNTDFKPRSQGMPKKNFEKNFGQNSKVRHRNPLDSAGNITRCTNCQSINHWFNRCPDRFSYQNTNRPSHTFYEDPVYSQEDDYDEEISTSMNHQLTLFQDDYGDPSKLKTLVRESMSAAVLDCGAPITVCGQMWLKCYLETLSEEDQMKCTYQTSSNNFKFGDSTCYSSIKQAIIPAVIGKEEVMIKTDVISSDIPLLLSMSSLIKAKANLDFSTGTINILGQRILLSYTSSGHYCLPLGKHKQIVTSAERNPDVKVTLKTNNNLSNKEIALKLHRQFGHCPAERLNKLVRNGSDDCEDLIKEITELSKTCKICKEYKKPSPRPVVGMPLATRFGECVAIDLKTFGKVYFMHLIDHATRLSAGTIIRNKTPSTIIKEIFRVWISIYGTPEKLLTDNGGEFNNTEVREACERLNIRVKTTAAESAWSNGMVERHHLIIADMIQKTIDDTGCSLEFAMMWSICAKNSLMNVAGFSPFQLVFSKNPTLPCLLSDKPPALNEESQVDIIRQNLNTLHASRQAFIKSESSEKIRRALRHNIRSSGDIKYLSGDSVYYKRLNSRKWNGPGTVLGQDGQQVLVKHGGVYVRVHPCRLSLEKGYYKRKENKNNKTSNNKKSTNENAVEKSTNENSVEKSTFNPNSDSESSSEETTSSEVSDNESEENQSEEESEENSNTDEHDSNLSQDSSNDTHENNVIQSNVPNLVTEPTSLLRKNATVEYKLNEDGEIHTARLFKRSGKATGKYKNEWNVLEKDKLKVINFDTDITDLKVLDDKSNDSESDGEEIANHSESDSEETVFTHTFIAHAKNDVIEAKLRELESWKLNDVYHPVENTGQQLMSLRWVLKPKVIENRQSMKARLVARGFEETVNFRTDSPTCLHSSVRVVLAIISSKKWTLKSLDYKTAFLQGNPISRELYVKPPKEANTEKVWLLKKTVYGLNDAPREWHLRLRNAVINLGCCASTVDPGLFFFKEAGILQGIILTFVDDQVYGGTSGFIEKVIVELKATFFISSEHTSSFQYIGINTVQSGNKEIRIDQNNYASNLETIPISENRISQKNEKLSQSELSLVKSKIGKINWIANMSRPDISFLVCRISSSMQHSTVESILQVNKLIKHIKATPSSILYPTLNLNEVKIVVYADASYRNLTNGASQGAFVIFLADEKRCCPIYWSSTRIKRVVKSTLAAETLALADACDTAFMLSKVIGEIITDKQSLPIKCITDNQSLFLAAQTTNVLEDKRLLFEISSIREMVEKNEIQLIWTPSKKQLSNVLTKTGASGVYLNKVLASGKF